MLIWNEKGDFLALFALILDFLALKTLGTFCLKGNKPHQAPGRLLEKKEKRVKIKNNFIFYMIFGDRFKYLELL